MLLTVDLWVVIALWSGSKQGVKESAALAAQIENTLGMKLMLVKPGRFQMGCPPGEKGDDDEKPQHWVEITQPYYLGVYEVTQGEFRAVMGKDKDPSHFTPARVGRDTSRFPVDSVTAAEAEEFCRRLSEREKDKRWVYRLPTEAEWEYACRAGTSSQYWSGDGEDALKQVGWYRGNAGGRTHVIGEKNAPNLWGLHDMHGNVWEWCADSRRTYDKRDVRDAVGTTNSDYRVLRGGSWSNNAGGCRAAYRVEYNQARARYNDVGFRVCVSARIR
jgi:formylglycine-generating enzyme required for sulfatase activity